MNTLYKNKLNEIFGLSPLDIQNGRDAGLTKLTTEEVEAHLNPPLTKEQKRQTLKSARDDAHNATCFEHASGKFIQLRPGDFAIIQNAVAQGYAGGWVMADNTVGQVTTNDLTDALAHGAIEFDRIFQEYITALEEL